MKLLAVLCALLGVLVNASQLPSALEAKRFLAALDDGQRQRAVYALDSNQKFDFHFVPRNVPGIAWKEMSEKQRQAGIALLKWALSEAGYAKIEAIRGLEPVLRELENGNPGRDDSRYAFVFFGEPSEKNAWAWRYEGHHLSLTFAYRDGRMVASTPQFLGSNPAEVRSGPKKGFRALPKELDLAFKLLGRLGPEQLKKARTSERAPADILTMNARRASISEREGLKFSEMDAAQQKLLLDLLRAHAEVQSDAERDRRMKAVQTVEREHLVFAWMGSTSPGSGHYYRILGEDLLVEYDNTQNGANHIHTVWRNRKEDFGGDPLEEHYLQQH
jgi:hypothetical protein